VIAVDIWVLREVIAVDIWVLREVIAVDIPFNTEKQK
jgi:hypothetical protein